MRPLWLGVLLVAACHHAVDEDGDGFEVDVDCDDADAEINPDAAESCNGVDDNCDGATDDADPAVTGAITYYADADADGYGDVVLGTFCAVPATGAVVAGDCDDADADVHPEATEACDGVDNDCDTLVDQDDPTVADDVTWYRDADGDAYGSGVDFVTACATPDGYVAQSGDCDDGDADRNPGAPEICDGKDNNCDVATGLLVDAADPAFAGNTGDQFLDDDGDGVGGDIAIVGCDPSVIGRVVGITGDCDDDDDTIFPGATEGCDAVDNDCDGTSGDDEWSRDEEVFRIPIDVTGASTPLLAPPVGLDVDLNVGLPSGETPALGTIRLVRADCASGFPTIAAEFADPEVNFFGRGEPTGPTGLGQPFWGMLGFRYDTDGNWTTKETLAASATERFWLYYSSTTRGTAAAPQPVAPAMTVGTTSDPSVDNGNTKLALDPAKGGLASVLGQTGGDNVGAQTTVDAGNGMFLSENGVNGAWSSATTVTAPVITQVYNGRLMNIWKSTGGPLGTSGAGVWSYTYTWIVFNGRPEVYVKVTFRTNQFSYLGPQAPGWATAVRPYEIDNQALGAGVGASDPGFTWARAAYAGDTGGVFLGWRTPPVVLAPPLAPAAGRFLALSGQDFSTDASDASHTLHGAEANTSVVDGRVILVFPYAGPWTTVDDQALGLLEGVDAFTAGGAEVR